MPILHGRDWHGRRCRQFPLAQPAPAVTRAAVQTAGECFGGGIVLPGRLVVVSSKTLRWPRGEFQNAFEVELEIVGRPRFQARQASSAPELQSIGSTRCGVTRMTSSCS